MTQRTKVLENEYYLPSMSLWGLPHRQKCEMIQLAGFNGVEIHVNNWNKGRLDRLAEEAREEGLGVTFHQPWSLEENPSWVNIGLNAIGYLPADGYCLRDVFEKIEGDTADRVVYANRMWEAWMSNGGQRHLHQTCSTLDKYGKHTVSWKDFVHNIQNSPTYVSVAFDTQHIIEYMLGATDVTDVSVTQHDFDSLLETGWQMLDGYKTVAEIHFNDCDPALGAMRGRNVWPGMGVLYLGEFANRISSRGWKGRIVPEVRPDVLFPYTVGKLRRLRETVQGYFQ